MIHHIIIALIYTVVGYILRMIVANYTSSKNNWIRAVDECNKARTKFFRYGSDEARKEWKRASKDERDEYDIFLKKMK